MSCHLYESLKKLDSEVRKIERLLQNKPEAIVTAIRLPRRVTGRDHELAVEVIEGRTRLVLRRVSHFLEVQPPGKRLVNYDFDTRVRVGKYIPRLLRKMSGYTRQGEIVDEVVAGLYSARLRMEGGGLLRRLFGSSTSTPSETPKQEDWTVVEC